MKYVLAIAMLGLTISLIVLTGCDTLNIIKNNTDMCALINCAQLGIIDIAGPYNRLAPTQPDYSKDPFCTLPGMCGPNIYYPYSIADSTTSQ